MSESCQMYAHCYNSKGEEVDSKLYKDLLDFTSNNRVRTNQYYGVGINQEFLNMVQDKAEFDENGEITISSLLDLVGADTDKESIIGYLNKKINSGIYDYTEAIQKLQDFNRNSSFKKDYLATLIPEEHKYRLMVVENTSDNVNKLENIIRDRSLQDRIMYYLNKAGVSVNFMKAAGNVQGRYSTKNALRTADSLCSLISLVKGKVTDDTLAEEAGHFVVGSLTGTPLMDRFLNLLTPEVQREILGNEYDNKIMGDSARREVAGTLIGRALAKGVDKRTKWKSLLDRILYSVKKMYSKISGEDIRQSVLDAKHLADQIAKGFMSSSFKGTVDNALKTQETLFSAQDTATTKLFKTILSELKLQTTKMGAINRNLYKIYKEKADLVEAKHHLDYGTIFTDFEALEGITEAVALMYDELVTSIADKLDSVDFNNVADFNTHMVRNAKSLRTVRVFLSTVLTIQKEIDNVAASIRDSQGLPGGNGLVHLTDDNGKDIYKNLMSLSGSINDILHTKDEQHIGMLARLRAKETEFFLRFLEDSYGKKYITLTSQLLFNFNGKRDKEGKKLPFLYEREGGRRSIKDYLSSLESDITLFERYLTSMANNSDIIGQIVDKVAKQGQKNADSRTLEVHDRLRILDKKFKKAGINDYRVLYEKNSKTGELTGYILSPVLWGEWESDWLEFKENCKEKFDELYPNIEDKSDLEKAVLWEKYFHPLRKEFHKGTETKPSHSIFNPETNMYEPNPNMYKNKVYNEFVNNPKNTEAFKALQEYMDIKRYIDQYLPEGAAHPYRLPQFKSRFIGEIRNRHLTENMTMSTVRSIRSKIRETFCESSEDTDYGSQLTFNELEDDIFRDQYFFDREKVNRIPLYGINKLKDMKQLSPDMTNIMFQYAAMAFNYNAMSQIVDTLEVGSDVLSYRKVGSSYKEGDKKEGRSRAYNRYLKFLEKQVYGIGMPKISLSNGIILNKIIGFTTSLATAFYLGGNVHGAGINTLSGLINIIKEAMVGERYTTKDLMKALKAYFSSLPGNWAQLGSELKEDKVSLFIRHFNVLGDSKRRQKDWHPRDNFVFNLFRESMYLPYKTGDHFMQSMAYLSVAYSTKLYDKNGNEVSMYDAYTKGNLSDIEYTKDGKEKKVTYGRVLNVPQEYFKGKDDYKEYATINTIKDKIDKALESVLISPEEALQLTKEEEKYLKNNNYDISDLEGTSRLLQEAAIRLTWNEDDESSFMNKAREINDRMHGIYSELSKVAFQQDIFGSAFLAFKGYALGYLENRIGSNKFSIALDKTTEGTLNTFVKLLFKAKFCNPKLLSAMLLNSPMLPKKWSTRILKENHFSDTQIASLKRNNVDFLMIGLLSLLKAIVHSIVSGDTPEEEKANKNESQYLGITYYFLNRLLSEQVAFNTPQGIGQEITGLTSIAPIGANAVYDISSVIKTLIESAFADPNDPEDFRKYYYIDKETGEQYLKARKMFFRKFPYLKSWWVATHPWEATDSYNYIREAKGL